MSLPSNLTLLTTDLGQYVTRPGERWQTLDGEEPTPEEWVEIDRVLHEERMRCRDNKKTPRWKLRVRRLLSDLAYDLRTIADWLEE